MRLIPSFGRHAGEVQEYPYDVGMALLASGRAVRPDATDGTGDTGDAALPEGSMPADSQSPARPSSSPRSRRRA